MGSINVNLKDILTLPINIMIAVFIAAGLVLFLPESIVEKLYIAEFKNKYGFILGSIFILFGTILVITFITITVRKMRQWHFDKYGYNKFIKNGEKALLKFNEFERMIILGIYITEDNVQSYKINNGAIKKLMHLKIISLISSNNIVYGDNEDWEVAFHLQPWVFEVLENIPDYFDDIVLAMENGMKDTYNLNSQEIEIYNRILTLKK